MQFLCIFSIVYSTSEAALLLLLLRKKRKADDTGSFCGDASVKTFYGHFYEQLCFAIKLHDLPFDWLVIFFPCKKSYKSVDFTAFCFQTLEHILSHNMLTLASINQ